MVDSCLLHRGAGQFLIHVPCTVQAGEVPTSVPTQLGLQSFPSRVRTVTSRVIPHFLAAALGLAQGSCWPDLVTP